MRKAFNFYRTYWEVLQDLTNPMDRLSYLEAVLDRQFTGKEPSLKGLAKIVYNGQKYSIDKSVEGYENATGKKLLPIEGPLGEPIQGPIGGPSEGPTQDPLGVPSGDVVMTTEGPSGGPSGGPSLQELELEQEQDKEEEQEEEEEFVEISLNSLDPDEYIDYVLEQKLKKK